MGAGCPLEIYWCPDVSPTIGRMKFWIRTFLFKFEISGWRFRAASSGWPVGALLVMLTFNVKYCSWKWIDDLVVVGSLSQLTSPRSDTGEMLL